MTTQGFVSKERGATTTLAFFTIVLILVAVRVPFILTGHVVDDSFITFRTALNFADHGIYSFNLGGHEPGTTSILYTLLVAAVRFLFRAHFLMAVQLMNATMAALAAYFLVATFVDDQKQRLGTWLLVGTTPTGLLLSYLGMETSLLILCIALGLYLLRHGSALLHLVIALLPLIRPDAVMVGGALALALLVENRRRGVLAFGSLSGGGLAALLFNRITSGYFIPGTMIAKKIHYAPDTSIKATLTRIAALFWTHSFLVPVDRGSVQAYLAPVATTLALAVLGYLLYRFRYDPNRRSLALVITGLVLVVPMVFAYGGIIQFPWYFEPSAWLLESVAAICLVQWASERSQVTNVLALACLASVWTGMGCLRLVGSFSRGTQEFHYRGDMGRYLANISGPADTMFLEPAGLIPFYSHLTTADEVGLVSQSVVDYHRKYPVDWWWRYVEQQHPTYLVERSELLQGWTYHGYRVTPDQMGWINAHYCIIRTFHYDPTQYYRSKLLTKVLIKAENPVEDWLIYRYRDSQAVCAAGKWNEIQRTPSSIPVLR